MYRSLVAIPAPVDAILSGDPDDYPPKLTIEASRGVTSEDMECIILKGTNTRSYTRNIKGFEVYFYEHIQGPFHPSKWELFWEGPMDSPLERLNINISHFKRNRRYFISVRILDTMDVLGPFSDPVSIDIH